MQIVTREQFSGLLQALDIQPGDGLLVHSAIQFLGRPQGGAEMYLQVLLERLGARGTLAVPAFNFAFAQGQPYDPRSTPSSGMGVFSELVRCHPQAGRTSHPMQSLAVVGWQRDDLVGRDTPSAFDDGSAFDRMLQLDFKLLLLGADIQAASLVHYSEQRAGVPYRAWKEFPGEVIQGGRRQARVYRMFVRDLDLNPILRLAPIERELTARGQWRTARLNYGRLSSCRLRDFKAVADDLLAADPWALVENPPQR